MGSCGNGAFRTAQKTMKLGYHAPPPGSRSGVADYAARLRPALEKFAAIELDAAAADLHLYHLGNNRLHEDIYARAVATPGLVVLHDAVLQHFFLGTCSQEQYLAEWVFNYGEWKRDLGEELWRDRTRASVDARYFRFPMLRRVMEQSRGVIVHNPGAAAIAIEHGARQVFTIPHFFESEGEPDAFDIARFRCHIGAEAGTTLFGIFGYLREPKRISQCINAFRKLRALRPQTVLLIAGDVISRELARLLASEAAHPGIRRLGHLSDADLKVAGASVDCCLNLRYPAAGETSGIATRVMGSGIPVIATDSPENADIPPDALLRVTPGVAEAMELFNHMLMVTEFPQIARAVGMNGKAHVRLNHALVNVADLYGDALCKSVS